VIRQGDVYWLTFDGVGSEPDGRRPAVVVQHDRFNRSAIQTVVITAVTSNLRLAGAPGNVRLRKGEAGLPKASVVNVSQLGTVDRGKLVVRIGKLSTRRLNQVLEGVGLVLGIEPMWVHRSRAVPPRQR
jgi:mRNA interferase MazF